MRILLYTGKGGVGKTTLSAATALVCAAQGHRTLVISTDPAHSLADSFDVQLSSEPTPIVENLWAQEVNVLKDIQRYWGELQTSLSALLVTRGFVHLGPVVEVLSVVTGVDDHRIPREAFLVQRLQQSSRHAARSRCRGARPTRFSGSQHRICLAAGRGVI